MSSAEQCADCGKDVALVWHAENSLWAKVTGQGDGLCLCIHCFDSRAQEKDLLLAWVPRKHGAVAELADAAGSNPALATGVGSTPTSPTNSHAPDAETLRELISKLKGHMVINSVFTDEIQFCISCGADALKGQTIRHLPECLVLEADAALTSAVQES